MQTWSAPFHCIILNFRNKLGQLQVQKWPEFKPVCLSNYEHRYVSLSFVTPQNHQLLASIVSKPICSSQNLHLLPVPSWRSNSTLTPTVDPTCGELQLWWLHQTRCLLLTSKELESTLQHACMGLSLSPITPTFSLYAVVCTPYLLFYITQSSFFKIPTMWCPHSRLC